MSFLTASAWAQPAAGEWEVTLGGSGNSDNDFDRGAFSLDGSLGYYLTDNWEVSLRQGIGFSSQGDRWSGNTRGAVDYNFQLGNIVPYLGANIGYLYGDDFEDRFAAGPEAGVKWYVLEKTFIFTGAEYQFFFEEARDIDNQFKDGNFVFTVGIGFNI
ncbi:MAG: hypothetical protein SFY81_02240 [Verrucomicrobiota bacterium]|nr:hypothetical protein [Verrucomicrobiota bacterium]